MQIEQDRGVGGRRRTCEQIGGAAREVSAISHPAQPLAQRVRQMRIVLAKQKARGARLSMGIDVRAGDMFPGGQIDVKNSAATGRIIEMNVAAQTRDNLFDDAQAEPGPALPARIGGVGLREFFENARLELGRNAAAHDPARKCERYCVPPL